jgi:hypothetical protein
MSDEQTARAIVEQIPMLANHMRKPITDLIMAALAAERERCAKVAENYSQLNVWNKVGKRIAAAIRQEGA